MELKPCENLEIVRAILTDAEEGFGITDEGKLDEVLTAGRFFNSFR